MREQSQKNEMAAALKGDFQRLRQRGVATTLGPVEEGSDPSAAPELIADDERPEASVASVAPSVEAARHVATGTAPPLPVFTRPAAPIRDTASEAPDLATPGPAAVEADAVAPTALQAGSRPHGAPPPQTPAGREEPVVAPVEAPPRRSLLGRLLGRRG